jgi:hypothetical protein
VYDAILRFAWLRAHSPMECDWDQKVLPFQHQGERIWLKGDSVAVIEVLSHPVLEGKPNANHVRARIRNSRTQRLNNWTSSHNARDK